MTLPQQPKRIAIIGAGAIGCEFADFYNAIGTEVTIVEMLDHLLPNEDEDVSILLERSFAKRGIDVRTQDQDRQGREAGRRREADALRREGRQRRGRRRARRGRRRRATSRASPAADAKLELFKNRVKVDAGLPDEPRERLGRRRLRRLHWPEQDRRWAATAIRTWRTSPITRRSSCVETICRLRRTRPSTASTTSSSPAAPTRTRRSRAWACTEKKAREAGREIADRQVPLQRQRPRAGGGRDRRLREADLRRQVRRTARRPHDRRERHRTARRSWCWPESSKRPRTRSSRRCTRTRRCPKRHGSRRRGGRAGDSSVTPTANGVAQRCCGLHRLADSRKFRGSDAQRLAGKAAEPLHRQQPPARNLNRRRRTPSESAARISRPASCRKRDSASSIATSNARSARSTSSRATAKRWCSSKSKPAWPTSPRRKRRSIRPRCISSRRPRSST